MAVRITQVAIEVLRPNIVYTLTVSGPAVGFAGYPSPIPFVAQFNGLYTGTVTFSDGGAGGSFSPSASVTCSGVLTSPGVYYTPPSSGTYTISATASPALGSYTSASYTTVTDYLAIVTNNTPGAVSSWRFSEAPGATTGADSIGSNTGTYVGGILGSPGMSGTCFRGDGSYAYLNIGTPATAVPLNGPYTLSAWVNISAGATAPATNFGYSVLYYGTPNSTNQSNGFQIGASGGVVNQLVNYWWANDAGFTIPQDIRDGKWHHIAVTFDGATRTGYFDGASIGSVASSGFNATSGGLTVGRTQIWTGSAVGSSYMPGKLDEVTIHNTALGASAILGLFTAGTQALKVKLSGPSSGYAGYNSTQPFLVGHDGTTYTGTVTLSDGGAGGSFSPSATVTFSGTSTNPALVYYNAPSAGTYTISASSSPALTTPTSLTYTAASAPAGYKGSVLTRKGIVAYWKQDETAGATTAVDSAGGYNGTYSGAYTLGQAGVGTSGTSVTYNGGYITVADTQNLRLIDDLSLVVWFKTTASGFVSVVGKYPPNPWNGYGMSISAGKFGVWVGDQAGNWLYGNKSVNDGKWHQAAVTRLGNTISIYVDGALDVSATRTPNLGTTPTLLQIATDPSGVGTNNFIGTLDEVALYNVALSSADVLADYNATGAIPTARVSQAGLLAVDVGAPKARVSQAGLLAVDVGAPKARVSQAGLLAVDVGSPKARVSQAGLLVIVPNISSLNYLVADGDHVPSNYIF